MTSEPQLLRKVFNAHHLDGLIDLRIEINSVDEGCCYIARDDAGSMVGAFE